MAQVDVTGNIVSAPLAPPPPPQPSVPTIDFNAPAPSAPAQTFPTDYVPPDAGRILQPWQVEDRNTYIRAQQQQQHEQQILRQQLLAQQQADEAAQAQFARGLLSTPGGENLANVDPLFQFLGNMPVSDQVKQTLLSNVPDIRQRLQAGQDFNDILANYVGNASQVPGLAGYINQGLSRLSEFTAKQLRETPIIPGVQATTYGNVASKVPGGTTALNFVGGSIPYIAASVVAPEATQGVLFGGLTAVQAQPTIDAYRAGQIDKGTALKQLALTVGPVLAPIILDLGFAGAKALVEKLPPETQAAIATRLQSETGGIKLPGFGGKEPPPEKPAVPAEARAGEAVQPAAATPPSPEPVTLPADVKDVLRRKGIDINKTAKNWEVLPPENRQFITDMARSSLTDVERVRQLKEGRVRQAGAISAAATNPNLSFAERQALASKGMGGTILQAFEPIGEKYTPEKIKVLTDQIDVARDNGTISNFQWKTAGDVFNNLMTGGKQLEPKQKELMGRIFGPEFVAAIPDAKSWNAWREAVGVLGIPQALTSTFDVSAVGRQMAPLGWSHPQEYWSAVKTIGQAVRSDKVAIDVMNDALQLPWATKAPYPGAEGLSFLDLNGRLADIGGHLTESEGQFSALNQSKATQLVEKLPWVKPSERVYNVPINVLRLKVYSRYADALWQMGERDPKQYRAVADVIDHATGWSNFKMGQLASGINAFYSPRNFAARFEVLLDPIRQPGSLLKPSARQLAARNLVGFVGANTAMLGLLAISGKVAAQALGIPNPVHVELDPRSADWGKGKVGAMRIDMTGGFGSIIRLAARLAPLATGNPAQLKTAEGDILSASPADLVNSFVRGKLGIVPGALWDAMGFPGGGKFAADFRSKEGWQTFAYNSLTPFFVQDVVEAWKTQGPLAGLAAIPLGAVGLGVQTYGPTPGSHAALLADLGLSKDATPQQIYEAAQQNPDALKKYQEARAGQDTPSGKYAALAQTAINGTASSPGQVQRDAWLNAGQKPDGSAYTGQNWKDDYHAMQSALAAQRIALGLVGTSKDPVVKGYDDIFSKYTDPATGQIIPGKSTELYDALDQYEASLTPAQQDTLAQTLGWSLNQTPTIREYRDTVAKLKDAGVFDVEEKTLREAGVPAQFKSVGDLVQYTVDALMQQLPPDQRSPVMRQLITNKLAPKFNKLNQLVNLQELNAVINDPQLEAAAVKFGLMQTKAALALSLATEQGLGQ